jgi:hypothetical protein
MSRDYELRLASPILANEEGDRGHELDVEAANDGKAERILAPVGGALFQLEPNEVRWRQTHSIDATAIRRDG